MTDKDTGLRNSSPLSTEQRQAFRALAHHDGLPAADRGIVAEALGLIPYDGNVRRTTAGRGGKPYPTRRTPADWTTALTIADLK